MFSYEFAFEMNFFPSGYISQKKFGKFENKLERLLHDFLVGFNVKSVLGSWKHGDNFNFKNSVEW